MRTVKAKLTEGTVEKTLFKMTVPMTWGILAVVGFNLTDTYFIGQLGTHELAAISFTFPVVMVFASIAMGLGTGASSVISRVIGSGDQERVKRLTTDSLTLSVLIVLVLIFVGYFTIDPLFRSMGAKEETLPLIRSYMEIWYYGMIFLVVPMVGNSAIRATGDTKFPALIMLIAAGTNLLLDPILIFGLLGVPKLGMQGAAIATILSRSITFFASLYVLHKKYGMINFTRLVEKESINSWLQIIKIGVPTAASNMVTPLAHGVITIFVATYGAKAVAAFGVVSRIESFSLIVLIALASTLGPFVGQNWGAGKIDRVKRAVQISFRFSLLWGCFAFAVFFLFAQPIVGIFSRESEVIQLATFYLVTVSFSYGFSGLRALASATFNTLGYPIPPTALIILQMLVVYIPLAYLGSNYLGIQGIFYAALIANCLVGITAILWTSRLFNKTLKTPVMD